jgi:hypothetical protein
MMIKSILVPVFGFESYVKALSFAADIAENIKQSYQFYWLHHTILMMG